MSIRNLAFTCILLLSIQQVAWAVTCYSCEGCDSVDSSTKTATGTHCIKIVSTGNGETKVNRDAINTCTEGSVETSGITVKTHCCSTDKCNTGLALSSSLGLAFALAAIVLKMNH